MARGNGIVITADPKGNFLEGYIAAGQTPKPGTVMQIQPATALKGGRHTFEVFNRGGTGRRTAGPLAVLLPDKLQGKLSTDAYAAGDRCFLYCPLPGDEMNMLLKDVAGTADDHPLGETLIVDEDTGKLVVASGSEQILPFVLLETITDPVADTLAWTMFGGY